MVGNTLKSAPSEPFSTADVFVSYAREDLTFVRDLETRLAFDQLTVWFDVKGLFGGERFWDEICKAIDAAAAVVFIIAPESIGSVYCRRELQFAGERQKRIVPVLRRDVPHGSIPQEIEGVQWVFLRDTDEDEGLEPLKSAIRADWVWLRQHARLLSRGSEWSARRHDDSLLLRGNDLRDAEAWMLQEPGGRERPILLQREFIAASRRAATRRRLAIAGSLVGGGAALVVVALLAASYFVANLNSRAREALDKETSDNISAAQHASARAVGICRYLPRTIECLSANVNLGIAERVAGNTAGASNALSRVLDQLRASPPRSAAEWTLLATARWERAVTTIFFAEAAPDEDERARRYALAAADMSEAQRLFDNDPEQAAARPLAVTRARLMLAAGAYEQALDELGKMAAASAEKKLVLSLAYQCLGRSADASRELGQYVAALPEGTASPQFKRELPFLERNSKCVPLPHR